MDKLIPQLMHSVEVQDARQCDVIYETCHRDCYQPDQSENSDHGGCPLTIEGEKQRRPTDDEVGLDGEEGEGVETTLDTSGEVSRTLGRRVDAESDTLLGLLEATLYATPYREAVAGVITFRGATRKSTRPWGPIAAW